MRVSFKPFSLGPRRPAPPHAPSLPRQSRRGAPPDAHPRDAALRYAGWGWPVAPGPDRPDPDRPVADSPGLGHHGFGRPVFDRRVFDRRALDYPALDCPAPDCPVFDCPAPDCHAPDCPALHRPGLDRLAPVCPGTVDLEQVHALWTRRPDAPVLGACGHAFDVVEADGDLGRKALARLDRLGAGPGPVVLDPGRPGRPERLGFLVRAGSPGAIRPWVSWAGSTRLFTVGQTYELPAGAAARRRWLREPGGGTGCGPAGRPVLPAAHLILGALALAPSRA